MTARAGVTCRYSVVKRVGLEGDTCAIKQFDGRTTTVASRPVGDLGVDRPVVF